MELKEMFEQVHKKLQKTVDVKFVFGEMIEAKEKSIIPVSAIRYAIGGGSGQGPDLSKVKGISGEDKTEEKEASEKGEIEENRPGGIGLGGKFSNNPLGVFEITEEKTKFIPVIPVKAILIMVSIWVITSKLRK